MSLLTKVKEKYKSDGGRQLINDAWWFFWKRAENYSPGSLSKVSIQLYWLPYLKILRECDVGYTLTEMISGRSFYFPKLYHHSRFRINSLDRKKDLCCDHNKVGVEDGDTVMDIGAFIGEVSISISNRASEVYSIEASPRSYKCLEYNAENFENITPLNYAVWKESTKMEFNLGLDPTEDSILDTDDSGEERTIRVQAETIENIRSALELEKIDFLKVEAEGVEPEILEGLGSIRPKKIVVNCDAERDGESPKAEVSEMLSGKGYTVFEGDDPHYTILYAKYNG